MFDSAGLAGWVETAMALASGTLVSSKNRRDLSYAISHHLGNAGQTRVATHGRVPTRGIRARLLPLRAEDRHAVFGTGVRARTTCMLALLRVHGIHLTRQRQGQASHFCHKQWITSRHTGTSGERPHAAMRFLGWECERAPHACSHHCEFMGYI